LDNVRRGWYVTCPILASEPFADPSPGIRTSVRDIIKIPPNFTNSGPQRAAWIPYFKEITALIFLAPISAFNERLTEDRRVNRLEDTFVLWKTICNSKLLQDVQIVFIFSRSPLGLL